MKWRHLSSFVAQCIGGGQYANFDPHFRGAAIHVHGHHQIALHADVPRRGDTMEGLRIVIKVHPVIRLQWYQVRGKDVEF